MTARARRGRSTAPLSALRAGATAVVARLQGRRAAILRLTELGLARGERVRLVRAAPLGDPLEVELLGYRLAIRRAEADRIAVRPTVLRTPVLRTLPDSRTRPEDDRATRGVPRPRSPGGARAR